MSLAPIILFVYNRPEHTRKTLEALADNFLADVSILYVYADGPKKDADESMVESLNNTRRIIKERQWCKEVVIIESEINKGLADSIVEGVTSVINKHGKAIILEDDIVTTSGFLKYMNDALNLYEEDKEVMHISGYLPTTMGQEKLSETFFLRYMNCWGWATWKDRWSHLSTDSESLYQTAISLPDIAELDFKGELNPHILEQLDNNRKGIMKTWAVKWYLSIFIQKGLCLYPHKSLVNNIGFDGSGENCGVYIHGAKVFSNEIRVEKIPIIESKQALKYMKDFFKYGSAPTYKTILQTDYPSLHQFLYRIYKLFKR